MAPILKLSRKIIIIRLFIIFQPRKLLVVLPDCDEDGVPKSVRTPSGESRGALLGSLNADENFDDAHPDGYTVYQSKDPVFENGNYRLNFKGRVSVPSVKNFQLVRKDNIHDIICQFGKVGDDRFHLDFKYPLNAFQAFSLALCQFNL